MVSLLDQMDEVKKIDKSDMLADLAKTPDYCLDAIERAKKVDMPKDVHPKTIVIVGMGGSAIGGEILQGWLRDTFPVPIDVCRDYVLPAYVNKDTLVFVNSYSGNTEETITGFLSALEKNCTVIAITSGGTLAKFCKKLNVPHVIIPSGLQPRVAVPYLFFPLVVLMEKMGLLSDVEPELNETVAVLEKVCKENSSDVPTANNKAKQIAEKLVGTIPVVYGFRQYISIAHRLKAQFNENSKVQSKADFFPELNHNETVGYDAPDKLNKTLSVILIRDPQEPMEIRNRIEITTNLVLRRAKNLLEITAEGKTKLAKMFSVMCTGDYSSVYLAILQNQDPSPVKVIEKLKAELAQKNRMKQKFEAELAKLE